ncbi:MAG: acyltransferase [Flavobacterium sp.]|nr:acyltransferase [Flavobacterium sp.]
MIKKLNILEAVRGGAALYVFLGHLILGSFIAKSNLMSIFFRFGQEAVILFFLMSGFVIELSGLRKKSSFQDFFLKRFFRIYPLFFLGILLILVFKIIYHLPIEVKTLLGNLLMLQDAESLKPGTIVGTYGNTALWSLSYEWWFYMLFVPISSFKNKNTIAITIVAFSAILYFFYPFQLIRWLMYFGIWWSGVMLADFMILGKINFKNIITKIIGPLLGLPLLLSIVKATNLKYVAIGVYPILEIRHFFSAIVFIIVALIWRKINWLGYNYINFFEKIAPFSYGLYVLHLPLILILETLMQNQVENSFIRFAIISLSVLFCSYLLETKFQKKLNFFLSKKS